MPKGVKTWVTRYTGLCFSKFEFRASDISNPKLSFFYTNIYIPSFLLCFPGRSPAGLEQFVQPPSLPYPSIFTKPKSPLTLYLHGHKPSCTQRSPHEIKHFERRTSNAMPHLRHYTSCILHFMLGAWFRCVERL